MNFVGRRMGCVIGVVTVALAACSSGGGNKGIPDVGVVDVGPADEVADDDLARGLPDVADLISADLPEDLRLLDRTELTDIAADLASDELSPDHDLAADLPQEADVAEVIEPLEVVIPVESALSQWGGYLDLHIAEGSGFFDTAIHDGRAWLVDPEGYAFFSVGVQAVGAGSLKAPALGYAPGTLAQHAAWAGEFDGWGEIAHAINDEHLDTMMDTGFNSVGGWSGGVWKQASGKIAYSHSLGFAGAVQNASVPVPAVSAGGFPDVFHPDFAAMCLEYADKSISPEMAADPWNLGYYSDNEQRWWGKDFFIESSTWTLADDFIDEAAGTPAKEAFVAYMDDRYQGDVDSFNQVYGVQLSSLTELADLPSLPFSPDEPAHHEDRMGFIELIADSYFSAVRDALKSVAPDHLYLCVRFGSIAPAPVIRKAGQYCDVVSINDYYIISDPITDFALGGTPEERWDSHGELIFEGGGPKPVLITEWGLRADDSGLPNTFGAGYVEPAQQDRVEFYDWSAHWFLARQHEGTSYITGWHWFMYMDEPATGRFDGEDGNYGVVSIRDEKYYWLLQGMKAANEALGSLLAHDVQATLLPPPAEVSLEKVEGGISANWKPVPGASSYGISILHHPAGLENRVIGQLEVEAPPVLLPMDDLGSGMAWVGVESLHPEALHLGSRVAGPVETLPPEPDDLSVEEVLGCEHLAAVHYHNEFPLPNDAAGQTYATLVESFVDGGGDAIRMDFIPSSLGFITLAPSPATELCVEFVLPTPLTVPAGGSLSFQLLPLHLARPGSEVVSASETLSVRLLAADGQIVHAALLEGMAEIPGESHEISIQVADEVLFDKIQFVVDLFAPGLPMDQAVRILVDNITVDPVS